MADASITDWIQAIISMASLILTAVGVIYVAKSLKSQNEVNKAQFELLAIESNRAAREVRPVIGIVRDAFITDERGYPPTIYSYAILCSENRAVGVCLEYFKISPIARYSENLKPGISFGAMLPGTQIVFTIAETVFMWTDYIIRVHYKDIDNRPLYDDFKLSMGKVELNSAYPATDYPSVNKINSSVQNRMMRPIDDNNNFAEPWPE